MNGVDLAMKNELYQNVQVLTGIGRAFGTCGELAQGQFAPDEDFLVTLPVELWSEIHVRLDPASMVVTGNYPGKTKTSLAIRKTLDHLGYPDWGVIFQAWSELPVGKGMASSSADIVAACRAVANALGVSISPEEISGIAIAIEPTDGVMYPEVVCYNHRQGRLLERLGAMPAASLLVLDLGQQVDTILFNRIPKDYSADEMVRIRQAYTMIKSGLQHDDLTQIGLGATLSAEINQRRLPKPHFDKIVRLARACGASGVCAAHSGTVLGVLFASGEASRLAIMRRVIMAEIGPGIEMFETYTLRSNGRSDTGK